MSRHPATDELLGLLRAGRWRPRAWTRFLGGSLRRSADGVRAHPHAAAEITGLHAALACLTRRPGSRWVVVSWTLAITHLGLLDPSTTSGRTMKGIGVANAMSLTRANLPALTGSPYAGVVALACDLADGRIARATMTCTDFGAYADALADAVFWTWFAFHHEPSRGLRAAALAAWTAPAVAITGVGVARGRLPELPRPVYVRPAAALQTVLALRAIRREIRPAAISTRDVKSASHVSDR